MFIKIILLTWILFFKGTNLSVVIDSLSQKGIVLSEYCPKMPYCEEGAHVMCMYYDPTRVMGPLCTNPRNVSMTSELAIKLLEVSNAVRGKMAMGIEKGKGGVELPRAYGMFKLHWDNELATFAQVLANQCRLRHDMCRATKRFPDPGQTAGLVRFSAPDWIPVSKSKGNHFTEPGLVDSKITYAVTQALKSWYSQKSYVTPAMIIDTPDWTLIPTKQNGRPFLEMISAPATHMGCGISAYADYAYHGSRSPLNYNSMQVVCNFSSRPKKNKPVYDLEPGPHTSPCGCPPDAIEDENCLCVYTDKKPQMKVKTAYKVKPKDELDCDGVNCEQAVILLPIFTVEDAPPSKLISRQGSHRGDHHNYRNNLLGAASSLEFNDDDFPGNRSEHVLTVVNGIVDHNPVHQTPEESVRPYLEKSPNYKKSHLLSSNRPQQRKTSIFSRLGLSSTSKANNPLKLSLKDFKKDVVPRKDFSKAKHLLNNYMESIKNYSTIQFRPHITESKDRKSKRYSSNNRNINDAEIVLIEHDNNKGHSVIHKDMGRNEIKHNEVDHNEIEHNYIGRNEITHQGDRDAKLMTLLDKLEEEVQHIELTGNKKELFDAKIRKIYDSVVGKSSAPKNKHISETDDFGHGEINKLVDLDIAHDRDLEHEHDSDHEHDNMYKKELERKDHKLDKNDIAKTMDDIVHLNHNDNEHRRSSLDYNSDRGKDSRMRIKARLNSGFSSDTDIESDYDYRDNSKKSLHKDKLYRSSDNEYKTHRFPEYRKSYKSKSQYSHEDFKMNRFNVDEPRNGKRLKHRDYYKSRDGSSIESLNKNHYRRHQTRGNEWNIDDDVLSPERRKYYQERLENLERQLQNTRTRKFRNDEERHRRPMRVPGFDEETMRRPSKNRMDHFDMRERSRFLHGF
ncbi:uncharacterized protein LOC128680427 isoform X2 [Plodia interpunctella]|uniref:uncharacterized protein LOC128680427 isoform X2 n=1 Tax=Plodia interpunctella TaxID=58824 RepID=UPI0023686A80|nr:uncharacterized protein LOC128680427 isoform X2 [Plodia interpunctella]